MAKFRQGDLVLSATEKIIQGTTTIISTNRECLFNSVQLSPTGTIIGEFSTDGTFTSPSDLSLPTCQAVKTYVDNSFSTSVQPGVADSILRYDTPTTVHDSSIFINDDGDITGVRDLYVNRDMYVDGTTFVISSQHVTTSDNIITLNDGEIGSGVTSGTSGIEIDRGTLTNYNFLFDEVTDTFRIGEAGSLQAVATREDSPDNDYVPYWNDVDNRFDTTDSRVRMNGSSVEFLYDSTTVAETIATGFQVSGSTIHFSNPNNEEYSAITTSESGNRTVGMDFVADDTYTEYGLRIVRNSDGPNATSQIIHRGTGDLEIVCSDVGNFQITLNNKFAMKALANGAVEFYHNGTKVAETTSNGITGAVWG